MATLKLFTNLEKSLDTGSIGKNEQSLLIAMRLSFIAKCCMKFRLVSALEEGTIVIS